MAKQGRPRGVNINPPAVLDLLNRACLGKGALAAAAGISSGHLADLLYRRKGTNPDVVRRMADALGCSPETLAPQLTGQFISVRIGDDTGPVVAVHVDERDPQVRAASMFRSDPSERAPEPHSLTG